MRIIAMFWCMHCIQLLTHGQDVTVTEHEVDQADICSDKEDLLELKQTARKFNARDFERLVNRHLKQLYGGESFAHFGAF